MPTTRFPNGLNYFVPHHLFRELSVPLVPEHWHIDGDDFDTDDTTLAGAYTKTVVGVTPTSVLTPGDGGLLLVTNSAAAPDSLALQRPIANFLLDPAKDAFFAIRLKINDVLQSVLVAGLQADDTTPFDVTDGIFFQKADGVATVDLIQEKTNVQTVKAAITTLVNDTYVELGWYHDASRGLIMFGINGIRLGDVAVSANFPNTVNLVPSLALQNGEAVAKNMTVDYWFAGKQRA